MTLKSIPEYDSRNVRFAGQSQPQVFDSEQITSR